MEAYIYFSTLREFLRFKRLAAWLLLAVGAMGLAVAWPHLNPLASPMDQYTNVVYMLVFRVLALAAAIYTTAIVSQEVEQRTIVYLLTRPVARWKLILFRYLAAVTVVSAVSILSCVLVALVSFKSLSDPVFIRDVTAILFGSIGYCALFLIVSLLVNRAMIVCLLFAFGWETLVPNMPGEMYHLSVYSHILGIADHPAAEGGSRMLGFATGTLSTNVITPGSGITNMLVLGVVLAAVSALWFTKFEYMPREDAE